MDEIVKLENKHLRTIIKLLIQDETIGSKADGEHYNEGIGITT